MRRGLKSDGHGNGGTLINGNGGTLINGNGGTHYPSVFCPGFQKGRVPSEKGTFSAVNGPSKGHN